MKRNAVHVFLVFLSSTLITSTVVSRTDLHPNLNCRSPEVHSLRQPPHHFASFPQAPGQQIFVPPSEKWGPLGIGGNKRVFINYTGSGVGMLRGCGIPFNETCFKVYKMTVFLVSCFQSFKVWKIQKWFDVFWRDCDLILPNVHLMLSGRSWSLIQDVQAM